MKDTVAALPRRPWLAGLLSFLVPGLGQLYNRRPTRGATFYVSWWLLAIAALELMLHWNAPPWNIAIALLLFSASPVGIVVDAVRDARRNRQTLAFGRWYVHFLIVLFVVLVVAPVSTRAIRTLVAEAFRVPTAGMAETILVGDRILVDKAAFGLHIPWANSDPSVRARRNQIVVFRSPSGSPQFGVRRIVGLPGEEIQIRDKRLLINGEVADEPFVAHIDPKTYDGSAAESTSSC